MATPSSGGRPSSCSGLTGVHPRGGGRPQSYITGTQVFPTCDPLRVPSAPQATPPSLYSACSYVKRMKEFERERRLLQRKKRREQREARGQGSGDVGPEVAL